MTTPNQVIGDAYIFCFHYDSDQYIELHDWMIERLNMLGHPKGIEIVFGSYSGFSQFSSKYENEAILFKMMWSHLITAQDSKMP